MANDVNMVAVGLGSNRSDALEQVQSALLFLNALLCDGEQSSLYVTPSMGHKDAPEYTNAVFIGTTRYGYEQLVSIMKAYETLSGRVRGNGEPVAIDLDLVMWNGKVLRERDFNAVHFRIGYEEIEVCVRKA